MADETVFICYRRDDTGETAGRIFDRLRTELPAGTVFRDLDSIPLGVDFRGHVRAKLAVARVVLVLIGPDWLTVADAQNRRRLDNAADHVRVEVELALRAKNVRVIPILCRHAEMPGDLDLPESIRDLAFQNGDRARPDPDFHRDVDRLRDQIKRILADAPKKPERKPKPAAAERITPLSTPAPVPAPAPPKSDPDAKKSVQAFVGIALFLIFWGAVIFGVWTGGRYVVGKVSDYFHKPTPSPVFPYAPKQPAAPTPAGARALEWKEFKSGGDASKLLLVPTPTPTPGVKPFGGLGRREPSTELLFPSLLKTPTPTPTPSFNEQLKKILGDPPSAPAKPDNR